MHEEKKYFKFKVFVSTRYLKTIYKSKYFKKKIDFIIVVKYHFKDKLVIIDYASQ